MGTPVDRDRDSDSPSPNALGDLRSFRYSKKPSFSHESAASGSSLLVDDEPGIYLLLYILIIVGMPRLSQFWALSAFSII